MRLSSLATPLAALFCVVVLATADTVSYSGHKVLRINAPSFEALDRLSQLGRAMSLDFWKEPSSTVRPVDVRVSPEQFETVTQYLDAYGYGWSTMVDNVQDDLDAMLPPVTADADTFYQVYHTYEEIVTWLVALTGNNTKITTLIKIGVSHEGRDIWAVKVSGKAAATAKPALWIDAGIHAREWITVGSMTYVLGTLVAQYGVDAQVTALVDAVDWYILPVFNVDGYSYTWTNDRMWRKTRSPNAGSTCVGTDPNRNWGFHWGEAGASTNPCADDYQGRAAFTEVELVAVSDFIKNQGHIQGYINFHSYGQLWMSPWGYTSSLPTDYTVQNDLSAQIATAIRAVHGTTFKYGPISTTIYPASGSSADWTYGVAKTLFSYGVELRDTGRYGFVLPPAQIVPSGEELFAGLKVFAAAIEKTAVMAVDSDLLASL